MRQPGRRGSRRHPDSTSWSTTPAPCTARQLSDDGIELTWALNHLAPFLLTRLLLDRLKASAPSRIITTASEAHQGADIPFDDLNAERSYRGFKPLQAEQARQHLFTLELARRLEAAVRRPTVSIRGLVASSFNRNNGLLMELAMMFSARGAQRREGRGDAGVARRFTRRREN